MEYKTDSLLVHLARAGDEDACEKLVKKYYSSIYQYCLLHINDPFHSYLCGSYSYPCMEMHFPEKADTLVYHPFQSIL